MWRLTSVFVLVWVGQWTRKKAFVVTPCVRKVKKSKLFMSRFPLNKLYIHVFYINKETITLVKVSIFVIPRMILFIIIRNNDMITSINENRDNYYKL